MHVDSNVLSAVYAAISQVADNVAARQRLLGMRFWTEGDEQTVRQVMLGMVSSSFYDLLTNAMMEWEEDCPENESSKKHEFRANRFLHFDHQSRKGASTSTFTSTWYCCILRNPTLPTSPGTAF
jgi:hypothetical protein